MGSVVAAALVSSPALATSVVAIDVPPAPVFGFTVDGQPLNVSVPTFAFVDERGKTVYGIGASEAAQGFSISDPGYEIRLSGIFSPNPSFTYGLTVTDFGAPTTFGFSVSSSIVATTGPVTTLGSISGGLTDFSGNGISLTPAGGGATHRPFVGSPTTSMSVDVGSSFSTGSGTPGALYAYGPFSSTSTLTPSGPWTVLGTNIGFTLSGGQDQVALTTFARIEPVSVVPIPAALPLMVAGLVALGVAGRRRGRE